MSIDPPASAPCRGLARIAVGALVAILFASPLHAQHRTARSWSEPIVFPIAGAPVASDTVARPAVHPGRSTASDPGGRLLRTAPVAVAGSFVGALAGVVVGVHSIPRDDREAGTLTVGAVSGAVAGATFLSAAAAFHLGAPSQPASFGRAVRSALWGILPGMAGVFLAGAVVEEPGDWLLLGAFAVGQGFTTGVLVTR